MARKKAQAEMPAKKTQLEQIIPQRRRLLLSDAAPREMAYDFNAIACFERVAGGLEEYASKPSPEAPRAAQDESDSSPRPEPPPRAKEPTRGSLDTLAAWGYALTSSWREDNEEAHMTFAEFRRLIPVHPPERLGAFVATVSAQLSDVHGGSSEGKS